METRVVIMAVIASLVFSCVVVSLWQAATERRRMRIAGGAAHDVPSTAPATTAAAGSDGGGADPKEAPTSAPPTGVVPRASATSDPAPRLDQALAHVRTRYAWNRHDLARWLGLPVEQLDVLAREPLPDAGNHQAACDALTARFGIHRERLVRIVSHAQATTTNPGADAPSVSSGS